jgi:hypothetical protein
LAGYGEFATDRVNWAGIAGGYFFAAMV